MSADGRRWFVVKALARLQLAQTNLRLTGRVNVLAPLMDTPAPIIALCFLGVFSSAGNSNLFKWQVCTFTSPGELQAVRVFVSLYDFTGVKNLMASVV